MLASRTRRIRSRLPLGSSHDCPFWIPFQQCVAAQEHCNFSGLPRINQTWPTPCADDFSGLLQPLRIAKLARGANPVDKHAPLVNLFVRRFFVCNTLDDAPKQPSDSTALLAR